jgi:hypothetical protein
MKNTQKFAVSFRLNHQRAKNGESPVYKCSNSTANYALLYIEVKEIFFNSRLAKTKLNNLIWDSAGFL